MNNGLSYNKSGINIDETDALKNQMKASIERGDCVLGIASNGLHTNGYTLVRKLLEMKPDIVSLDVDGKSFLETIMKPHPCYYKSVRGLFGYPFLKGLAHITGGGLQGNLNRILPDALDAVIDLSAIEIPKIFRVIRYEGNVTESDMLRTFNMGIGLAALVDVNSKEEVMRHIETTGGNCFEIGRIVNGQQKVHFEGSLNW
jgi:phosphoribosylformylglycinamidine cyclo-ligase